ncbi:MAG: 30S ribosomal protein S20, partial [Acidimicrobiales bacterium]
SSKVRTVANIKSQIKRNRQNEKRRLRNRSVRSELRTQQKAAEAAAGTDGEAEALQIAIKKIDKAASKGVLHKNTAARRKSRLVARVQELAAQG